MRPTARFAAFAACLACLFSASAFAADPAEPAPLPSPRAAEPIAKPAETAPLAVPAAPVPVPEKPAAATEKPPAPAEARPPAGIAVEGSPAAVSPAKDDAAAAEPPKKPAAAEGEKAREEDRKRFSRLLTLLDSDQPHEREEAAADLKQWLGTKVDAARLREFAAASAVAGESFEARQRLATLWGPDAAVDLAAGGSVSDRDLDHWLDDLDGDDFNERQAARDRLRRSAEEPKLTAALLWKIKRRLDADDVAPHTERQLVEMYDAARRTWLSMRAAPPPDARLTPDQLRRWVEVVGEAKDPDRSIRRAERELLDALLNDALVPVVRAALDERLRQPVTAAAEGRLLKLREWTMPAMVAEIWTRREEDGAWATRQVTAQYLLVNVPWRNPDAPGDHASHFDYVDDERAHCVDGYTLAPGDYPVHAAFPHPSRDGVSFFHIVNLPTPRRRMEFESRLWAEYQTNLDQDRRLTEVSERTCRRLLEEKVPLSEAMIPTLLCFDGKVVSRFLSDWWKRPRTFPLPEEQAARESMLCFIASRTGTLETLPGLVSAAEKHALGKLSDERPVDLLWGAALCAAERTASKGSDDWLADHVRSEAPLLAGQMGDVGATAAAALLKRYHRNPADWGLEPVPLERAMHEQLERLSPGFRVYYFARPAERARVLTWWREAAAARSDATALLTPPAAR